MLTIADIAKEAFDGLELEISDAILAGELFENVQGAYDQATASHPVTETSRGTFRAILETQKPVRDVFPDYVAGPGEELFFIEGLSNVPKEGWIMRINGNDRTILRAQDILLSGSIAYVVTS